MIAVNGAPEIDNWEVVESKSGHFHIRGNVYGHDIYEDGTPILTSRIVDCLKVNYPDCVRFWVKTRNSVYQLLIEYSNDNNYRDIELIMESCREED